MKKIIVISLIILIFNTFLIFNNNVIKSKKNILISNYIKDEVKNSLINGYLKIDKINLLEVVYDVNSKLNTLNNGLKVSYLKPFVILGHSGSGDLALFNNLDKLGINDLIEFNYNKITYYFKIDYIYEKDKDKPLVLDGDILLVTCKKNTYDKQLVIRAKSVK